MVYSINDCDFCSNFHHVCSKKAAPFDRVTAITHTDINRNYAEIKNRPFIADKNRLKAWILLQQQKNQFLKIKVETTMLNHIMLQVQFLQ